jgi:cytochrome oxidase Cu insertion factor (SCO1/SenC/PrrC family)
MRLARIALPALAAALSVSMAGAQQPAAAPPTVPVPEVGSLAPDFEFTPITAGGIQKPTKLSALKGQTVVVWFFFKARTRG